MFILATPGLTTFGILAVQPETEPQPPVVGVWSQGPSKSPFSSPGYWTWHPSWRDLISSFSWYTHISSFSTCPFILPFQVLFCPSRQIWSFRTLSRSLLFWFCTLFLGDVFHCGDLGCHLYSASTGLHMPSLESVLHPGNFIPAISLRLHMSKKHPCTHACSSSVSV